MSAPATAVRSPGRLPPGGVPAPPGRMPLLHGLRPRKAWRYVGLYGSELMLCAGRVRVGGIPQSFWAIWDREAAALHQRTTFTPRQVAFREGQVHVRGQGVAVNLRLESAGDAVEVRSPHGASWIWTRKTPVRALGTVQAGGRTHRVDMAALIDDSAGYHARATDWEWSAGVGTLTDGRAAAWNLVAGVHDAVGASECTVWVDGHAHEAAPVQFAPALDGITFAEGGALAFTAEAVRERHDAIGPLRSDYVQPFGTFAGALPGAGTLATGFGVMERHHARW